MNYDDPNKTPSNDDSGGEVPASLPESALDYARRGWQVFPCAPRAKIPLTEHGFHDATTDPDQINRWWRDNPAANIGIATGDANLVVIDIDEKHGGFDSFARLCREC